MGLSHMAIDTFDGRKPLGGFSGRKGTASHIKACVAHRSGDALKVERCNMGIRNNDRFCARGKQRCTFGADPIQHSAFDSNGITFGGIDSQFHLFAKPFFDESALAQQVAQGIRIALLDGGADAGDVVD